VAGLILGMKIICRKHEGLIDVPEQKQLKTLDYTYDGFVFNCPVCNHQLVISSVQRDLIEQRIRLNPKLSREAGR
jgi:hypothetical protein